MGCDESKQQVSLTEQYVKAGLRMPSVQEYDNEFEKQIYLAINMCRHEPSRAIPSVRTASKHSNVAKTVPKAVVENLISYLKKAEHLAPVYFDDQAQEAVRKNNLEKIALEQETPDQKGNIAAYSKIMGEDKVATCDEFTMCQWENSDAMELVAL